MSVSPKLHQKLKNPKNATVSLDSLLGLLSSAYGTEELDSKNIFKKNAVDWRDLSVENFKNTLKKEVVQEDKQKSKPKLSERNNVSTSTTNLKANRNSESEIDVTLVSIKSLERLKQSNNKSEQESSVTNGTEAEINIEECKHKSNRNIALEDTSLPSLSVVDPTQEQMEDAQSERDSLETDKANTDQCGTICGFYVDDMNHKIIFDIQFTKKITRKTIIPVFDIGEPEITINVTDTIKSAKVSIKVDKSFLISKVHYFSDVDKEFGLDNLNVIVRCNLNVFQWIIQWVKADIAMCKPNLNVNNLKAILSMAYHLKIYGLIEECLDYLHQNFNSVLESNIDIEDVCDDDLLLKLVKRFSNTEINEISDVFETLKMKMFCILIKMLVDPKPCLNIGHYSTLSGLFQCGHCGKFLNQEMVSSVPCKTNCNQLNFKGELVSFHERSPSWDLSKYIELMYEDLYCWQLVYWRLWGMCHFLSCQECQSPYPLGQSDWCPYHPLEVEYFSLNPSVSYPTGMYKCCGEKAFKFNVLEPYGGCKFGSHKPELNSDEKVKMYNVYQLHKKLISCQPSENVLAKRFVKMVKNCSEGEPLTNETPETFWWQGVRIVPKEKKDYSIISLELISKLRNKPQHKKPILKYKPLLYEPQVHFGMMPLSDSVIVEPKDSSASEIGLCFPQNKKNKPKVTERKSKSSSIVTSMKNKMKKRKSSSFVYQPTESVWLGSDSNKDNQDNQRDFEEIAMRSLVKMLTPETSTLFAPEPAAGSYIRLEAEWWHEHCGDTKLCGASKNSRTVVNRTFPLSWFRRLTI